MIMFIPIVKPLSSSLGIDPVVRVTGTMVFTAYTLHLTEVCEQGETGHWENVTRIFQDEDGDWRLVHFHKS